MTFPASNQRGSSGSSASGARKGRRRSERRRRRRFRVVPSQKWVSLRQNVERDRFMRGSPRGFKQQRAGRNHNHLRGQFKQRRPAQRGSQEDARRGTQAQRDKRVRI